MLQWPVHVPVKSAPSHGGSGPHLMYGSLDPRESASQMASRPVQPFLHSSPVCPTYTYTMLHMTSVATGCTYALHAGDTNY